MFPLASLICLCLSLAQAAVNLQSKSFDGQLGSLLFLNQSRNVLITEYSRSAGFKIWRSEDEAISWSAVQGEVSQKRRSLIVHPHDSRIVLAFTANDELVFISENSGKDFSSRKLPAPILEESKEPIRFHATEPRWLLVHGKVCQSSVCFTEVFFSQDLGLNWRSITKYASQCYFSRANKDMISNKREGIACTEWGEKTGSQDSKLSTDLQLYLRNTDGGSGVAPVQFDGGLTKGAVGFGAASKYFVVALKKVVDNDLDMYTSIDGERFTNARFPYGSAVHENGYTVLESTPFRLFVNVMFSQSGSEPKYGSLYVSDSDGDDFSLSLNYTNINFDRKTDFEKVQALDGVILMNIVENANQLGSFGSTKQLESRISFNDGSSWSYLKKPADSSCTNTDPSLCSLHLHSVSSPHAPGAIYSSKFAPGVLLGMGNVGDYLRDIEVCDLYMSTEAGNTWRQVQKGHHLFEMGNFGGIIVAIPKKVTNEVKYSTDYGKTWKTQTLPESINPKTVTIDPNAASSTFIVVGQSSSSGKDVVIGIDFSKLYDRTCNVPGDFDEWTARNMNDDLTCLLGHSQKFWRPKSDSNCIVRREFPERFPRQENCACTSENYECDYNFFRKNAADLECTAAPGHDPRVPKPGECQSTNDMFYISKGYRKIPGDTCTGEVSRFVGEKISCSQASAPASGVIVSPISSFFKPAEIYEMENSVLLRDISGGLWWSDGKTAFTKVKLAGVETGAAKPVSAVRVHDHVSTRVFVFTDVAVFYSSDSGKNFNKVTFPQVTDTFQVRNIDFHPTEKDWLVYLGEEDCPGSSCHSVVSYSGDNGATWRKIDTYAVRCLFSMDSKFTEVGKDGIYCLTYKQKSGDQSTFYGEAKQFMYYPSLGQSTAEKVADNVLQYYVFNEFLALASKSQLYDNGIDLQTSKNGRSMNLPQFFSKDRQSKSFTILQTNSKRILLDRFAQETTGLETGQLWVSDTNGKEFSLSLAGTNRDSNGYVDVQVLEMNGWILANRVEKSSSGKSLKTYISTDDGARWARVRHESESTFVNLHLRTSRPEEATSGPIFVSKNLSSVVVAIGSSKNEFLPDYDQCDTFISTDGGMTWKKAQDGRYKAAILNDAVVLIKEGTATNGFYVSWDWSTWEWRAFSRTVKAVDIIPMENYRFIVVGAPSDGGNRLTLSVDLSNSQVPECVFKEDGLGDLEIVLLKKPGSQSTTFLGSELKYWRKKPDRKCKTKKEDFEKLNTNLSKTVFSCQPSDYECRSGYRMNDNYDGCVLDYAIDPAQPSSCPAWSTFTGPNEFRKIPTSVCTGKLEEYEKTKSRECSRNTVGGGTSVSFDTTVLDENIDDTLYLVNTTWVLFRSSAGSVYQSLDAGKTFEKQSSLGSIKRMQMNPYTERQYYLLSDRTTHYKLSVDPQGADSSKKPTFDQLNTPVAIPPVGEPLEFHAEEPGWIILQGLKCSSCDYYTAYISRNGGQSWDILKENVKSCEWARDKELRQVQRSTILCRVFNPSGSTDLERSDDFFRSSSVVLNDVDGFKPAGRFIAAAVQHPGQKLQLYSSRGYTEWVEGKFPSSFNDKASTFTIVESGSDAICVNILGSSPWGSLWVSDRGGKEFVKILDRVVVDAYVGYIDYERIIGISGIGWANQAMETSTREKQSLITFSDGAEWHPLAAPEKDSSGATYQCNDKPCRLHIQGFTKRALTKNEFSDSAAPGMLITVGNVGTALTSFEQSNMFLSNDAGKTWKEIAKGPHLFEFVDHGGIIVMVPTAQTTSIIRYSIDGGATFVEGKLPEPIKAQTILTEPDSTSLHVLIIGSDARHSTTRIYHVDFKSLINRDCNNDDFEQWQLTDIKGNECINGKQLKYRRRKSGVVCSIGDLFKQQLIPQVVNEHCKCTESDFECAFGFERVGKECKPIQGLTDTGDQWTECRPGDEYSYSKTAYRLRAATQCQGGLGLHQGRDSKRCPATDGSSSTSVGAIIGNIFLSFAMVGIAAGLWLYGSKRVKWMSDATEWVKETSISAWRWVHSKIGRRRSMYRPVSTEDYGGQLLEDY